MPATARERRDVFLCYARSDARFVDRLAKDLADHHITSWIDTLDIKVGDSFRERIEAGIESARHFCFVISPASMKSFYVQKIELDAAFSHMVATKRVDSFFR
jgi:hypothetical protein